MKTKAKWFGEEPAGMSILEKKDRDVSQFLCYINQSLLQLTICELCKTWITVGFLFTTPFADIFEKLYISVLFKPIERFPTFAVTTVSLEKAGSSLHNLRNPRDQICVTILA